MQAAIFESTGDVEVLHVKTVPDPEPGPGEVVVRVEAVGVNRLDLMMREGRVPARPMPHIAGSEVAGTVVAVGAGVTRPLGQRVAVAPYLFCGQCESCLAGHETVCLKGDILGLGSQGGYAEYVVVADHSLIPIPDGVSAEQAAAVTLSTITAWHMLVDKVRIRPGDWVLVWAAGSGVGSAAVQIAKMMGAKVIATAGQPAKVERAMAELGADYGIDYSREDVGLRVRELTQKRGVDVVFEHLGQQTLPTSVRALAREGRIVTCGTLTGNCAEIDVWTLFAKELQIVGSYGGTREDLRQVLQAVAEGRLTPVIDTVWPLTDVQAAHRRMMAREQFGKILLKPTP